MTDRDDRHEHESRHARGGHVHITVAREEGGKPFALTVPDWLFKVALGLAGLLAVLIVGGGMLTARMGAELRRLHEIEEENAALRAENRKVDALAQELAELDALREQILALAGAGGALGNDDKAARRSKGPDKVSAAEQRGDAKPRSTADRRSAAELRRSVPAVPVPLLPPSMREGGAKGSVTPLPIAPAVAPESNAQAFPSRWPVDGVISKAFQINTTPDREHHGLDIAAPHGTPVHAAGPGAVAFAEMDSVFGLLVVINHGGGWQTVYGHNSRLVVGIGDSVRGGQEIAQVGSTGESSAPHLHFEVRRGGRPVDPGRYLGH
jgi:murein DD-endopeptidase MepM/ murein hydrolase activator NlpD